MRKRHRHPAPRGPVPTKSDLTEAKTKHLVDPFWKRRHRPLSKLESPYPSPSMCLSPSSLRAAKSALQADPPRIIRPCSLWGILRGLALPGITLLFGTTQTAHAQLGPLAEVGRGTEMAYMDTGSDGSIHIAYDGKYRSGPSLNNLNAEETITHHNGVLFSNVKLDVDPNGNPHVVYQHGKYRAAGSSYYTTKVNGQWITPEKFADRHEVDASCARAALPDVAADADGNVLACFWALENSSPLKKAIYRWRDANGNWSEYMGGLSGYHAATPKVAHVEGQFYLHYAEGDFDKVLSGPVDPHTRFEKASLSFESKTIDRSYQNEGTNFYINASGQVAAAGNFRVRHRGDGIGVWASDNLGGAFEATIISEFDGSADEGKGEGNLQPDVVIDAASGRIYVVYYYRENNLAYYQVKDASGWSERMRLLPEKSGIQGYFRNGPSVADIPGRGVVACVVNDSRVYLRTIDAEN